MCVSNEPADLNKTKGYIGEAFMEKHGLVHVLGYQNKVKNLHEGPNAMILHFPTKDIMTKENIIDLGSEGSSLMSFFCDYYDDRPKTKGSHSRNLYSNSIGHVEVFDTGIYTVVLASNPMLVNEALKDVDKEKRPNIHPELMDWYSKFYPNHSIAICCFNNKEAVNADPLFWWYKPTNEEELHFPAVDCHTGKIPNLDDKVYVDHLLTASVLEFDKDAKNVRDLNEWRDYKDFYIKKDDLKKMFPDKLIGKSFLNKPNQINGDFIIKKSDVKKGLNKFERVKPKL